MPMALMLHAGSWQEVEIEEAQLQLDAAAVELAAAAGALLVAEGEVEAAEDRKGQLLVGWGGGGQRCKWVRQAHCSRQPA